MSSSNRTFTVITSNSVILLLVFVVVSADPQQPPAQHQHRSELSGIWSELVVMSATALGKECPSCLSFVTNMVAENALRTSRLESIKKSILESLGMTEPPKINVSKLLLPLPIKNGDILRDKNNEDELNEEEPMDVPKTSNKVLIVASGTSSEKKENEFDVNFKIDVPWSVQSAELSEATLWLYTDTEDNLDNCEIYSKTCNSEDFNYFMSSQIINFKDGWTQIDITATFNNWLEYEEFCQQIKITCKSQINEIYKTISDNKSSNKPFVIVNVIPHSSVNRSRNKRNINCSTSSTDCCREKLVVSFAQLKWDNWIIQPRSYDAYFCKGKCENVASISLGNSPYYSVLQRLNTEIPADKLPDLRPCCAPSQLSSLEILYMDQNETFSLRNIPNMVVKSCGCM